MDRDPNSHGGRRRTVARVCLYAIAALAPLVMTRLIGAMPLTHDAFELPKAAVVRFAAAVALLMWTLSLSEDRQRVRLTWWFSATGVYGAWVALATVRSESPIVSALGGHGRLDGLLTVLTYLLLGFLSVQLFTQGRHLVELARTVTVSGAVVALYGAAQTQGFHPFYQLGTAEFTADRAFASMGNPVFLGGYLVLVLPVMTVVALSDAHRGWRAAAWSGIVLATVALIGTATRAAWLVGIVEFAALCVLLWRKRVRIPGPAWVSLAVAAAAGTAVVVRSLRSSDQVMNVVLRLSSMFRGEDGSSTERFLIARSAVDAIVARPWFGYGPGRFTEAFNRFRPDEHVSRFAEYGVDNAHNMILQTAATAGVIAALAWTVAVAFPLVVSSRQVWSREGGSQRLVLAGLWLGAAGYALFLQAGISVVGSSAVFWIILGQLAGFGTVHTMTVSRAFRTTAVGVATVFLVAVAFWSGSRLIADNRYVLARAQVHGDATGDPLASTQAALSFSPWDVTYRRHLVLLAQGADPQAARLAALKVLEVEPDDVVTLVLLTQTYLELGETEQAARVLQHAMEVAPNSPSVLAVGRAVAEQGSAKP